MEQLELKHLAGYLPYGLKIECKDDSILGEASYISEMTGVDNFGIDDNYGNNWTFEVKPILRPLSDLAKEIEHNGEKFVPIERLRKEYSGFYFERNPELLIKSKNTSMYISLNWTNEFQQKLYEWHFDIHGGIGKGLAIDINTLK